MIKHIVFFRFKGEADEAERRYRAGELAKIFAPLGELACVNEYHTGINFSKSEDAWDFVIDSSFNTSEDLEAYRISREHQEAIAAAKKYSKEKSVIDYKIDKR